MTRPRDPTQFTRESAERIANVVRAAELASPAARPLSFEPLFDARKQKLFRVATFTGAWSINATKTVTFKYQTATPNTVVATNLFFPVTSTAAGNTDCGIAKDGTAWFLIDVPFETATAVFAGATSVGTFIGTGSTAITRFYGTASTSQGSYVTGVTAVLNTAACTIGITLSTQTMTILTAGSTQTAVSISMSGTQTFAMAQATFTATFLRFKV
jgi:hypothetical protein